MKKLLFILLPLILTAEMFPSNSADFTAYAIGFGGGEAGYLLTNLFTDNAYLRIIGGIGGSILSHAIFSHHFSTDGEQNWAGVGRGHWIGMRITYDMIKNLTKKRKPVASAQSYLENRINDRDYDEILVFGLEQLEENNEKLH